MGCTERYASAWEFAVFWCYGNLLTGADGGGGVGVAFLTDAQGQFSTKGVRPNAGMILYNLTAGTSGAVTAVSNTSLTATGVTWTNGDLYRIALVTGIEIATIEHYLDIAASDIHAALAASGACDCTLAAWATNYLSKLNIIDAAAYYSCPCGQPKFDSAQRQTLLTWMNEQLGKLITMDIDVCTGETGSQYPYLAWAQWASTEFAAANIILDAIDKGSG